MFIERINATLQELIPPGGEVLFQAANYSLEGGKRLRPLLTLAVVETFGQSIEKALIPACAIEMIHTYSLIHDDLPCMDDDDFRRGKPTLHKAYPESHAVLTGDFLLTYAFEVLANAPFISEKEKSGLIATLALRAGHQGMIGGQVLDIEAKFCDKTAIYEMYLKKTGALFTAALEFGAILTGQNLLLFQEIGKNLGLAYQIIDDLLDEDGISQMLEKNSAQKMAETLFERALQKIQTLPNRGVKLETLAKEMVFRLV